MKLYLRNLKFSTFVVSLFALNLSAFGQTCLTAWGNKVPIIIDNSAGVELTDYQVLITINTSTPILLGEMNPDGSDIRFTADGCCDQLCYYIESGINTASTKIWVNVPLIAAGTSTTIYAFFGNPDAVAASNPECTFAFYTGFDGEFSGLEHICGSSSDSTVAGGDLNLAWSSNVLLGSTTTFPYDEVYTAEAMVNTASGNWPGVYWGQTGSQESYAMLTNGSQARISVSGIGGDYCSGHNWASPLMSYGSPTGIWSITWISTGNLRGEFPTVGTITSSDATFSKSEDMRVMIGGISSGSGSMNLDWLRVRKYAAIEPSVTVSAPVAFSPGPLLVIDDEAFGCGEAILDAGAGYDIYDWSSGGAEQLETIDVDGMYYITVTDDEGCFQIDSVDVTIGEIYSLSETITLCPGANFVFPDGTMETDITDVIVHTSALETEEFGCDSIIVTTVNVYEYSPVLDLGTDLTVCEESVELDAGDGFGSYNWSDGEITQLTTVTEDGTYNVVVTDDNGCEQMDEISVAFTVIDNTTSLDGFEISANETGGDSYQWLDCDNDYAIVAGATDPSFEAIEDGNYAVQITKGECVDTSDCVTISGVSIPTFDQSNFFDIYPNPTTGQVNLLFSNDLGPVTVKIMNVEGQLIQLIETGDPQITLTLNGANGVYFIEVLSSQGVHTVKVVKE